jgi:hypothetical protein
MRKNGFPAVMVITVKPQPEKLPALMTRREAGRQTDFSRWQPTNADRSISRSFDPGSNVTFSIAELACPFIGTKQLLQMTSTDAAMQIDLSDVQRPKV